MDGCFQDLVAAGANAGDGGTHDNVGDDAYSLRGFVIWVKHANSADHRLQSAGQGNSGDVPVSTGRRTSDHDRSGHGADRHRRGF